jgi:apolipoprotein N-acyltransferase
VKFLSFSFLAGLAAACGFQPLGLWPLSLAAFAFLLRLIVESPRLRSALARGWWFGFGYFTLGLNWIATAFTFQAQMPAWLGWIAVILLSLYLSVYPAAAAGLAWRWCNRTVRGADLRFILLFAAAWIVTEWLRASLFTGFAWNPLGIALLPTPVARLSAWIGTYGLSGVTVLLAGSLLLLLHRRWRPAMLLAGVPAAAVILAVLANPAARRASGIAVRIVQPNIGQEEKWQEGFDVAGRAVLGRLSAKPPAGPRILLWPEAAVTRPLENALAEAPYRRDAALLRRGVGAMLGARDLLLTGGVTWRSANGMDVTSATNSIFAVDPTGHILGRYDKAHLVPYGEYLPARPFLSAIGLSRLAPGDIDFDSGPGARTLDLPLAGKVGFQLCYEIIFSGEVVDRRDRPAWIFNPSNDAWFGAWGPPQHLAQARMRALEEGLPVLRSTPTGISAVIDGDGRLLHSLPWRKAGVIDTRLPGAKPPTLFARFGNALPLLLALLLAAAAFGAEPLRRRAIRAIGPRI